VQPPPLGEEEGLVKVRSNTLVEATAADLPPELMEVIRKYWNYTELLPHQAELMLLAMEGRHALGVLGTGSGKSLCFQAPALLRKGLTVVVCPLISLMKDQVDRLVACGVPAGYFAHTQLHEERQATHKDLKTGTTKLLYISPELLCARSFLKKFVDCGLSAWVIDEAHCVVQWGDTFRAEYKKLGNLCLSTGHPIYAFTATADEESRQQILKDLGIPEAKTVVGKFDRHNLIYRVRRRTGTVADQVLDALDRHKGQAGIIYSSTKTDVDILYKYLREWGVNCLKYHGGLTDDERSFTSETFSRGMVDVVIATNAFGMGLDRSDIRFIIQTDMPESVTTYVQEVGRAGRDGKPSECLLLYHVDKDISNWRRIQEHHDTKTTDGSDDETEGKPVADIYKSLNRILAVVAPTGCRHSRLALEFGQVVPSGCGNCDVCLGELEAFKDSAEVAHDLLAIVRSIGGLKLRYLTKNIETFDDGHVPPRLFGLANRHGVDNVASWLEQLGGLGYLQVENAEARMASITELGRRLLDGSINGVSPTLYVEPLYRSMPRAFTKGGPEPDLPPELLEFKARLAEDARRLVDQALAEESLVLVEEAEVEEAKKRAKKQAKENDVGPHRRRLREMKQLTMEMLVRRRLSAQRKAKKAAEQELLGLPVFLKTKKGPYTAEEWEESQRLKAIEERTTELFFEDDALFKKLSNSSCLRNRPVTALYELVFQRPNTSMALSCIAGLGDDFMEEHGDEVLQVIAENPREPKALPKRLQFSGPLLEDGLAKKLVAWKRRSSELGFPVFGLIPLFEIILQRPRKVQDFGKISGLNKHLVNNCGKDIIRIIVNHTAHEREELKSTKAARKRNRTAST